MRPTSLGWVATERPMKLTGVYFNMRATLPLGVVDLCSQFTSELICRWHSLSPYFLLNM